MKRVVLLQACTGIEMAVLAGYATKNYSRKGELSAFEKQTMTCKEIALEQGKMAGYL